MPFYKPDQPSLHTLAEELYNDAYWFDQLACSSPRLLVWVGSREDVDRARRLLFEELSQVIAAKGYVLAPGAAIAKLNFMYGALIDRPVERVYRSGNELVSPELDRSGRSSIATHPGAGLFFEARVDALAELVGFVQPQGPDAHRARLLPEELASSRDRCRAVESIASLTSATRSASAASGTATTYWPS